MIGNIFVSMCVACGAGFTTLLIWGISTTNRMGIPSISRMLADSMGLSVFLLTLLFLFGQARIVLTAYQVSMEWNSNSSWEAMDSLGAFFAVCGIVFGVLQILFLMLVCLVTLDYSESLHYVVAGLAVLFSIFHEFFMLMRRLLIYKDASDTNMFLQINLGFNLFFLLALVALTLAFGIISVQNNHDYAELNLCAIEFEVFWLIVFLVIYQLIDVGATCKLTFKVVSYDSHKQY